MLVGVTCIYRNISPNPLSLAQLPELYLEDRARRAYAADTDDPDNVPADPIPPGAAVERHRTFRVPAGEFDKKFWRLRIGGTRGARITLQ